MYEFIRQLWADDSGAILATEYTMMSGTIVAGVIPGFIAVRDSINASLAQTAGMVQAVAPQFTYSGWRSPVAAVPGLSTQPMAVQQPVYSFSQPQPVVVPQWSAGAYPAP